MSKTIPPWPCLNDDDELIAFGRFLCGREPIGGGGGGGGRASDLGGGGGGGSALESSAPIPNSARRRSSRDIRWGTEAGAGPAGGTGSWELARSGTGDSRFGAGGGGVKRARFESDPSDGVSGGDLAPLS